MKINGTVDACIIFSESFTTNLLLNRDDYARWLTAGDRKPSEVAKIVYCKIQQEDRRVSPLYLTMGFSNGEIEERNDI